MNYHFVKSGLYKPEILEIHPVSIYHNQKEIREENVGKVIAKAVGVLSSKQKHNSLRQTMDPVLDNLKTSMEEVDKNLTGINNNYRESIDYENLEEGIAELAEQKSTQLIEELEEK